MSKIFIEESTLTAIGNAIRGKEGTTAAIPVSNMAARITAIQPGGSSEPYFSDSELTFGGYLPDRTCSGSLWASIMDKEGTRIKFKDVMSGRFLFNEIGQRDLSYLHISLFSADIAGMFNRASVSALPSFSGSVVSGNQYPFGNCEYLRYLPQSLETVDWSGLQEDTNWMESWFYGCYSLRRISPALLAQLYNKPYMPEFGLYRQGFGDCAVLDELINIPVLDVQADSNMFYNTFGGCERLADIQFVTNADGSAKTANWANQYIDLSDVGCADSLYWSITHYNSGITSDKEVTDDTTYHALKNDPDWFSANIAYSRYNHDSAVRTIATLPDTSAYGANTISFVGAAGSATDGGAISDLTEEEIAVATAKGWTVTLS